MTRETAIQKIHKLQQMVDGGTLNEQEIAQLLIDKLMNGFEITATDLSDAEIVINTHRGPARLVTRLQQITRAVRRQKMMLAYGRQYERKEAWATELAHVETVLERLIETVGASVRRLPSKAGQKRAPYTRRSNVKEMKNRTLRQL